MTTPGTFIGVTILGALLGCASKAPPRVATPQVAAPRVVPPPVRLAVLPPDALLFSEVASALGERLTHAQIGGAGAAVTAKISMEVAQLSLECVSPTDECFVKVGRYLQVDRLLWGEVERDKGSAGLKVTVVLLDVGRGTAVGRAEGTFAEPTAAILGLQKLVDEAIRQRPALQPAALSQSERPPAEPRRSERQP